MIHCPKCKTELTENDVFCFVCGHKMEQPTLSQPIASEGSAVLKPCPQCQTIPASAEDVFCAECGYRLIPEQAPEVVQPEKPEEIAIVETQQTPVVEEPTVQQAEEVQAPIQEEVQIPVVEEPTVQQAEEVQAPIQEEAQENIVAEQPQAAPDIQPPQNVQTAPITAAVTPQAQQPTQQAPQTMQNIQAAGPFGQAAPKKRGAGKVILTIFLILLIVLVVGGGVFSFLIYNGNVSRNEVGKYIPKSMLDMIPSAKGATSTTATRYFVSYCFGQFDKPAQGKSKKKEKEKKAVVSDIYTNIDVGSETNDAAEVAFRSAGNEQIDKFSRFSNHFTASFSSNMEAMEERENIIKDLKSKGYKPEFIRVTK